MYNVFEYYGDDKPTWKPVLPNPIRKTKLQNGSYIIDNVLTRQQCLDLCSQFEAQVKYPVGIDGYSNSDENAGSYRAMGWSCDLAIRIGHILSARLPGYHNRAFVADTRITDQPNTDYTNPRSTPWVRFMKYTKGGMHVPHYDTSFYQPKEQYRTLYSWVLYLTTTSECEGEFQFVDDTRNPPGEYYSDWTRMATEDEILDCVQPVQGRLLVFPHWLCHQVAEFNPTHDHPTRVMVRGDVSYNMEHWV
jgi:hypothetical protein